MFLLSFFRVIKFSLQDISRNIWLSLVTIIIIILALVSINLLLVVKVISSTAIDAVKEKIDISLYLKSEAEESKILALKAKVSNLVQVEDVKYVPKQIALESFKQKHKDNPEILQALIELGKNPLSPSLVIKPKDVNQYDELIANLNKIDDDIIESRNFDDRKVVLEKINSITNKVSEVGMFISIIFVFITLLVVYNAIRVTIYTHRTEIGIMKLVGASNWFIRAPYLVSSLAYTLIGISATVVIFYLFLSLLQPYLEAFFIGYNFNIITYFNSHFLLIFGSEFLVATLINFFASLVAVNKYSKV
ncbi:permease-like cell division protein FtsX [Patescibacteria group bacterium]|nr:permease-like cell division protein FtsX [Patescibacteria group bacterium]MBU0879725.1 permease-like cell division protein FtsX [Patescibacteria group bacterium]MBU0880054.1 permease-like cell division protein FtsX [Patescibacteria group bacterium]MBU0897952.1 permease-like cell division protein FtsX [Patescibacteria group bacterium]MBU1062763.1 permease-like cell division protein FtsX [Patescibacteria group bacterium]